MKRKFILFLALTLALTTFLAACGGATEQSPEARQETLRVIMGLGENEWEVMRTEVFPRFEEKHNIRVEAVQAEAGDVPEMLSAQIQAGNVQVDLITQDVNNLFPLVDRDLMEDLTEFRDRIPEEVIEAMIEVSEFDGRLLFLPYRPNVEIAYYNENRFNEANLNPPRNWEELLNVARTFHERDGIGRVAIKADLGPDNVLHVFDFIRSAGGDPYVLNDEGSIRAFNFYKS